MIVHKSALLVFMLTLPARNHELRVWRCRALVQHRAAPQWLVAARMTYEDVPGGIRVTLENALVPALATYAVGPGAAVKPLSAALESAVAELAQRPLNAIAPRSREH